MVGDAGEPAGAEEYRVVTAKRPESALGHHAPVPGTVLAAPGILAPLELDAELAAGCLEHAQALGNDFSADAVAGNHGDLAGLERKLQKVPEGTGTMIIVDGVYSMEGDIADVPGLLKVAQKYGSALVVDDVSDVEAIHAAHERGTPVVVRASTPDGVLAALSRGEVACALVQDEALLSLDLPVMTYG